MGDRLRDKSAIVTGAGRGIGRASALRFADEGAAVVVADIDPATCEDTVRAIESAGGRAVSHPTNVTDSAAVEALVDRAVSEFGKLDIMFNNAGGATPQPTQEVSDEKFRKVVALNLDGVFFGTRAALRVMVPQKSGCLLTTTSGAGLGAVPGFAAYGMAKAGVINLTKSIAAEFGPVGIRSNVIAPGPIGSEGFLAYLSTVEGLREKMEGGVPIRRLGTAEDIASAALFLASDEASYITGAVVPVDGGLASIYPAPTPDE